MGDRNKSPQRSYKLRVNINGFNLSDVKVSLEKKPRTRVKINAKKMETTKNSGDESSKEFIKFYDISTKFQLVVDSMRYYSDPTNSLYLIVEFDSNQDENVFVNLDESCESLVEMAAKSLLNINDIEALRHSLENPDEVNPNTNQSLANVFSTGIIKDLNSATNSSFTPFKKAINSTGNQVLKIDVNVSDKFQTVSLADNMKKSLLKENKNSIIDLSDDTVQKNHLFIRFDGLNLFLEGNTTFENSSSFFSKQIKVPKGSLTKELVFKLDTTRHLIHLEVPYYGL